MCSMIPVNIDSHFELVSATALPNKKIVQIWPKKMYCNEAGYAVFLCEVENDRKDEDNGN